MFRLPQVVETVLVPDKLGPTQVARALECRLAGVLPRSISPGNRLPAAPRAVLGSIFHKLVQDARQGRIEVEGFADLKRALANHLDKLILAREADLATGRLAHYVPLRATLTFSEYLDRTTRALTRAKGVFRIAPQGGGPVAATASLEGVEVEIASAALGLSGSMDACHETPDEIVIRDLKTGNVRDAQGIAPHVSTQLGLYALMVREARPGKRIRLFVDHASSEELPWGPSAEAEAQDALARVRADLSPGMKPAMLLARPGSACRWCEARHVCPGYRSAAPTWWGVTGLDFVPPSDIAGTIESSTSASGETSAVTLRDLAGRHTSIVGITKRLGTVAELRKGTTAWFFGFAPRGSPLDADRRYSHPRNFREAALAQGERRAFNATLMVENV
jgi:RecB family exonuclease